MRLHLLRLSAVGPFAGVEEVDFDRLGQGGLFLLEGPTGVGKSTILDAVTFALYGSVAGSGSAEERLRSDFAPPGRKPEVMLEFSVNDERYRITRSPRHQRPARRGGGDVAENPSVLLERLYPTGARTLAHQVRDAAEQITDLLGLTRSQFTQVVLLPQGEFARFLQAGHDEREDVLRQLFDVATYEDVTDWLDRTARAARARTAEAQRALRDAVAAAVQAAALPEDHVLAGLDGDELLAALDAEAAPLRAAVADTAATAALTLADLGTAETVHRAGTDRLDRLARLAEARRRAAELVASAPARTQRAVRLARARQAAPVAPRLHDSAAAAVALAAALDDLATRVPDATLAERAGEGGADLRAASRARRDEAARIERVVVLESRLHRDEASLAARVESVAALDAEVAEHEVRVGALPAAITALESERDDLAPVAGTRAILRGEVDSSRRRASAAALSTRLAAQKQVADADEAAAAHVHADAVSERRRVLGARLAGIAAELAAGLVDGEPCAVCGSLMHPAPAQPAQGAVAAEAVDEVEAAAAQAAALLDAARATASAAAVALAAAEAEAGGLGEEAARAALADAEAAGAVADVAAARLVRVEAELAALRSSQRCGSDAVAARREQRAAAASALEAERAAHASSRAEVDAVRGSATTARGVHAALLAAAAELVARADVVDQVAHARAAHDAAAEALAAASAAAGFTEPSAAHDAVLGHRALEHLAHAVRADDEAVVRAQAALDDPDLAGLDPDDLPRASAALAEALARVDVARGAHEVATTALGLAAERSRSFAAASARVRRASSALADQVADAAALLRLDELARGVRGQQRMTLVGFVLRYWFDQVVEAANVRLTLMSSGRYVLDRTDDAARRDARTGLGLRVVDTHTGAPRPTSSLSGGESFYASLALALGLADVVSGQAGGTRLDTLFIDEGFGALDPETLESVLSVIDALREGGRVIGIVSHVADLKERIPERLEIRRADDRSSHVLVVA